MTPCHCDYNNNWILSTATIRGMWRRNWLKFVYKIDCSVFILQFPSRAYLKKEIRSPFQASSIHFIRVTKCFRPEVSHVCVCVRAHWEHANRKWDRNDFNVTSGVQSETITSLLVTIPYVKRMHLAHQFTGKFCLSISSIYISVVSSAYVARYTHHYAFAWHTSWVEYNFQKHFIHKLCSLVRVFSSSSIYRIDSISSWNLCGSHIFNSFV